MSPTNLEPVGCLASAAPAPADDTQAEGGKGRAEVPASSTEGVREIHPPQPAHLAPIPAAPGYFITADGRVLSGPKRRMFGKVWREMSVKDGKVRLPVRHPSGGVVMRRRSVARLVEAAFGGAR